MGKLTDKHLCMVLFLEMKPSDFISLMQTNCMIENLVYLDSRYNNELYQEAKDELESKLLGDVFFNFDYDSEPFVFDKYIGGRLDRTYKICIFEQCEQRDLRGMTSGLYINGVPVFYDNFGNVIKNSYN
jgi:hypothetical protein